jgi:glutamine amidotransferase-like uncharacterized protein
MLRPPEEFLRILTFGSVEVHRAEQPFSVATRSFQKPGTWYGSGAPAAPFDVQDPHIRIVARYGEGEPRLSGWVPGSEHIAGEPAIVEAPVGRGSVVLFGFQPNYRGQTSATWPLLFNAMQR